MHTYIYIHVYVCIYIMYVYIYIYIYDIYIYIFVCVCIHIYIRGFCRSIIAKTINGALYICFSSFAELFGIALVSVLVTVLSAALPTQTSSVDLLRLLEEDLKNGKLVSLQAMDELQPVLALSKELKHHAEEIFKKAVRIYLLHTLFSKHVK